MSKTTPGAERAPGSRLWRGVAIAALVVLAASLAAGLVWFLADPLHLPENVLAVLDQRASVVAMFTGTAVGVAGLTVALLAWRAQARAERTQQATATPAASPSAVSQAPPQVSASGEWSVAIGGDNSGIVSTGDGTPNVQMRGQASGQGRVYQAGGDQHLHEGDDQRRTYGGDHVEFHHNTFHDKVVGKQVTRPEPVAPERNDDGQH